MDEIRVDENGIMLRPRRRDDCVRRRAAEMALPQFKRWMGPGYSDAHLIKILMKHIDGSDGYSIAKAMERDCGDADSSLVDMMDDDFIRQAEDELVAQWVRCLGIKCELPIGTLVDYLGEQGTIASHDEVMAKYRVQVPSLAEGTHWIINTEDAKPLPAIAQESAA